jgi:hypothetical protein
MAEKTPADIEREERYKYIRELSVTDPDQYAKIDPADKLDAWRSIGYTDPTQTPSFVHNPPYDRLIALERSDRAKYLIEVQAMNPTERINFAHYSDAVRAAEAAKKKAAETAKQEQ